MLRLLFIYISVCFILSSQVLGYDFSKNSFVSPFFIRASETDTVFRNPAELTLHERVFDGRLTYGLKDERFGVLLIGHFPDYFPSEKARKFHQSTSPFGDFAFSLEIFGTEFAQNLLWIKDEKQDSGGRFTLADSGTKFLFTWAKRTEFLTLGANLKNYHYRNLNESGSERNAFGIDLGVFFTPLDDLFLGLSVNDLGDTQIKDGTWTTVTDTVPQIIRLTAAVVSGKDMSFSVGLPSTLIEELRDRPRQAWKLISFQGTKIFDNTYALSGGSNSKDLYAHLGYNLNKNLTVGVGGYRDLHDSREYSIIVNLSGGWAIEDAFNNWGNTKTPKIQPAPAQKSRRHQKEMNRVRSDTRRRRSEEKRLEKKVDRHLEKEDLYDEVRDDLNDDLDKLNQKESRLRREQDRLERERETVERKKKNLESLEEKERLKQDIEDDLDY
ncbi:MAG: hypothetical protein ACI9BD_000833 [Candidatus Marinamargulisbacteria bacterium]|jgi:hypothetical protein